MYGLGEQVGSRTDEGREGVVGKLNYFSDGYFLYLFLIFGVWVLNRVFGVGVFLLVGFGACGVGPSGFFWGWGSLYNHRRITLGTNFAVGETSDSRGGLD